MIITDQQTDALSELINIAFSRTAASLSDLTSQRVLLDLPEVSICGMDKLYLSLSNFIEGEVATMHQVFDGAVAGDALLVLNYDGAVALNYLLSEEERRSARLDESGREVLSEVGNILLNACLGVFGNLLKVYVSFFVPRLHMEALDAMMMSLIIDKDDMRYALVAYTSFRLRDSAVNGCLVIVLGVSSLDRLIRSVSEWEKSQIEL